MCNRAESQFTSPDCLESPETESSPKVCFVQLLRSNSGVFLVVKEKGCLRMYLTRIHAVSTSLSWIIENWIISWLTCIRSFQLRIIKLPLNPLLLKTSLSWKNRRCGSRGKLWLEKVLSRKSYGGVFLGDGVIAGIFRYISILCVKHRITMT